MAKPRILFLTAYVPNKAAAGEKNTMIMLNDLAQDYDVDLVYFKYDHEKPYVPERDNVKVLEVIRNSTKTKLFGIANFPLSHPVFSIRFSWAKLRRLRRLTNGKDYSAVVLNHSNVFVYGRYLCPGKPKLLLAHDVIIQRALRQSGRLMQAVCRYSEGHAFRMPDARVYSFSQKDVDLIKDIYHIPAEVNLDYIDPDIVNKEVTEVDDYFFMFGDWTRSENLDGARWFIENVSPLVTEPVTVKIVGRGFPKELAENARGNIRFESLGFVDDPYLMLSRARALISPLFQGAGIKVKVIESLACGTPVLGTPIAFEGLPDGFADSMILCDTPQDYVAAMATVGRDVDHRRDLKKRFIEEYSRDNIRQRLNRIISK